jgi:hypothetical protein
MLGRRAFSMGSWWAWTKWVIYYLVTGALLLAIYMQVIQTRFECVVFSLVALIYIELIAENEGWLVELLAERDHRNEIHRLLSARLDVPLDAEMNEAIDELVGQTQEVRKRHTINSVARFILYLIIVFNLLRAAFFW